MTGLEQSREYVMRPATTGTIEWLLRRRDTDPEGMFLVHESGYQVTYGELARSVERWAAHLAELGVGTRSRIAVMMYNHLDHIAVVFALQWLHAVHIPISTHQKAAGLAVQFETSEPHGVIAEAEFRTEVDVGMVESPAGAFVLYRPREVDGFAGWTATLSCGSVPDFVLADLDQPAMMAFTSGTTGRPKAAIHTERLLMESARQASILADLWPSDRLFMWEPLYHAPGWTTLRMALASGATIGMVEKFSASRCWDQIRATGSTRLHYLGGVINLLLKQPVRPDDRDHQVTIAWGGAAPRGSWRTFEERFGVTIREGYGLTEAANFAMLNLEGRIGSIGRPTDDMDAWIEDRETGERLVDGEIGQIMLRPKREQIVMSGYYGNPEATEAVLAGGVVRTGDLGYEQDGYFYFTGRATDSLRRRGENVSAWEVERVINEHDGIAECAVIGVPSPMGEDDIKLFVKAAPQRRIDAEELWRWAAARLAYFQVPRYIDIVQDFPYGPTQRIQKKQLNRSVDGVFDADKLSVR